MRNRVLPAIAISLCCAVATTACLEPKRKVHGDGTTTLVTATVEGKKFDQTVVFYSDSIGWEAKDALAQRLAESNIRLDYHGYPGKALCDYVNEIPQAVRTARATVVVVEFSGNIFTPCMAGVPGDDVYKKYRDDGEKLLTSLDAEVGTTILFASAPSPLDPRRQTAEINAVWQNFSALYPSRVQFVNAAEALNDSTGKATMMLPCLDVEGPEQGCVDGQIKVRSDDGVHFCPTNNPDPKNFNCTAKYASGAVRYAYAIADGVLAATAARTSP